MIYITKAKKEYKKRFGEANHLLITTLIGLDAIERYNIENPPEGFSTTWNPKSRQFSVQRSRLFTIQAFFAHIVDGIDSYFHTLRTLQPQYIEDQTFYNMLDHCSNSTYKKCFAINEYFQNRIDALTLAIIDLGITCRNNFTHSCSHQKIKSESQITLLSNSEEIKNIYCGLDIKCWLSKYTNDNFDITFKELASFIHASHNFISELDKLIVEKAGDNFEKRALEYHLSQDMNFKTKYNSSTKNKQRMARNLLKNKYAYSDEHLNQSSFIRELL